MSTQREFYRPKLGKNWRFSGRTIIISRPMRLLSDVVCKMTVKIVGGGIIDCDGFGLDIAETLDLTDEDFVRGMARKVTP